MEDVSTSFPDRKNALRPIDMFSELSVADREFNRSVNWSKLHEIQGKAGKSVDKYIEIMKKYRDVITPQVLKDRSMPMGGSIDPVFVALVRVIYGANMMTQDIYSRMRNEWCGADLPYGYDDIACLQDDNDFANRFQTFRFNESDNIRLLALQKRGVRDLMEGKATHPTPKKEVLVTPAVREHQLKELPIDGHPELLRGGSNETQHVLLSGDGGGIFKPGSGERRLEISESWNKLYKRERAAFLVDQALQLDLVPVTVIRTIGGREGSLQEFVDNYSGFWSADKSEIADQLFAMALFDYCIWNKDRSGTHILVVNDKQGRRQIRAIDNGLSFDNWWQDQIYENLESYVYDRPVPAALTQNFGAFLQDAGSQAGLRSELKSLVPPEATEAALTRIKFIGELLTRRSRVRRVDLHKDGQPSYYVKYFPETHR